MRYLLSIPVFFICLTWIFLATFSVHAEPATSQASPHPSPQLIAGQTVHRATLTNGLQIAALQTTNATVDIYLAVAAGKRHESHETTGLAHLTEHAMFAGTASTGNQQFERKVRRMGGRANAFTREDYTLYYDTGVPTNRLADVLTLEADRLRGLTLEPDAVIYERGRLEKEEAATTSIRVDVAERIDALLFPDHAYGAGLLDTNGHTRAPNLPVSEVRRFYDDWYHPNHAALVIAGPVEPAAALAAVRTAFEPIPSGGLPQPLPPGPPLLQSGRIQITSPLRRARTEAIWRLPGRRADGPVQDVLLSTLERRVQQQDGVTLLADGRLDAGLLRLVAINTATNALPEPLALNPTNVFRGLHAFADSPFTAAEIDAVKPALRQEFNRRPLHGRPYFSLPCELAIHAALGQPELVATYADAIDAVTPDQVNTLASTLPGPVFVDLVPDPAAAERDAELPDDPARLSQFAETAQAEGRWDDAIAAYTRLYETADSRMYRVIYLTTRGQVHMEARRYAGAVDDFREALDIVDYPAIRPLLDEAERLLADELDRSVAKKPEPIKAERKQELDDMVPAICREIEEWRGLKFKTPVTVTFTNVTEHEDLQGWYNSVTDELVVKVSGGRPRFTRGVLLHELVHALQDQHHDLVRLHTLAGDDPDAQRAVSCLIEGEAIAAVADLMDYDFGAHAELPTDGPIDAERFDKRFIYGRGFAYFNYLRAEATDATDGNDWSAVDAAFREPPLHTAAVLDPDLPKTRTAPDGWTATDTRRPAGAYDLVQLLAESPDLRPRAFGLASAVRWAEQTDTEWRFHFRSDTVASRLLRACAAPLADRSPRVEGAQLMINKK